MSVQDMTQADLHRANAAAATKRASDSWDRSDTDGFVSQWANGMTAQCETAKAEIAENGGKARFAALFDLEGNLVAAKNVRTQYGWSWMLLEDPTNPRHSRSAGWVNESKASNAGKRQKAMEAKGYRIGAVMALAGATLDSPPGARGLAGASSVFVSVFRTDGGYSTDVEIISNGMVPSSDG